MRKLKTNKSVAKRFKITKKGKISRRKAFKGHLLTKKKRSRKMGLKRAGIIGSKKDTAMVKKLLPYG